MRFTSGGMRIPTRRGATAPAEDAMNTIPPVKCEGQGGETERTLDAYSTKKCVGNFLSPAIEGTRSALFFFKDNHFRPVAPARLKEE